MQVRGPAKLVVCFQSYAIVKVWEPGELNMSILFSSMAGEDWCSCSSREPGNKSFGFCFVQVLHRLRGARPHWEGQCLLSVQYFKFSSLTETPWQTHPELMTNQTSGHLVMESSWHVKSNHHRVEEDVSREIQKCTEPIENGNKTCQSMWDAAKAALRGNFIAYQLFTLGKKISII